jgi:hypothetical protein
VIQKVYFLDKLLDCGSTDAMLSMSRCADIGQGKDLSK